MVILELAPQALCCRSVVSQFEIDQNYAGGVR